MAFTLLPPLLITKNKMVDVKQLGVIYDGSSIAICLMPVLVMNSRMLHYNMQLYNEQYFHFARVRKFQMMTVFKSVAHLNCTTNENLASVDSGPLAVLLS